MNASRTSNPNLKLALVANNLSRLGMPGRFFANILRQFNRVLFSCDISIGARIDPSCIFFQHVTLGVAWHGAFMTGLRMSDKTLYSAPVLSFSGT